MYHQSYSLSFPWLRTKPNLSSDCCKYYVASWKALNESGLYSDGANAEEWLRDERVLKYRTWMKHCQPATDRGCFTGKQNDRPRKWQKILKAVVINIIVMVTNSADGHGRYFWWTVEMFREALYTAASRACDSYKLHKRAPWYPLS